MQIQPPPAANQTSHTPHVGDEINLLELWQAVWQRKLTLLTTTLIGIVLGFSYLMTATPIYQAEVLLSPTTTQKSSGQFASFASQYSGLADLAGVTLPTHSSLNTAIATLESRRFIQSFIQNQTLKPLLFPKQWDERTVSWKEHPKLGNSWWNSWIQIGDKNKPKFETPEPSLEQAYKKLKSALSVSFDKKTGLVNLRIDWSKPELTAQWANQLVTQINKVLREQTITKAENSIDYLYNQLKTTQFDELRVLYAELIQEQTKSITLAQANKEYAFEILDPAVAPENPIKPKHRTILLLSVVIGLVLGIVTALTSNAMQSRKRKTAPANAPQKLSL